MSKNIISLVVIFCIAFSFSLPKSLGNHVPPLSKEKHYEHGEDGDEHNRDYDHEAFLGKDADDFDELPPEESKARLKKIVEKIDTNKDGYVSETELKEWLKLIQHRYSTEEVNKKWEELGLKEEDSLSLDLHIQHAYGSQETVDSQPDHDIKEMVEKDKIRWAEVDLDKDGKLSKKEYGLFLHPEAHAETQHIYALETLKEIDTNKNGKVELDEFLSDLGAGSDDEEDQSWIDEERNNFINKLDKDKDGALDLQEVTDWLLSEDIEQIDSETEHLFSEADDNKDNLLSEDEILDHYDVFVGSQATEYGEILHDEF